MDNPFAGRDEFDDELRVWVEQPGPTWRSVRRGLTITVTLTAGSWCWIALDRRGDVIAHDEGVRHASGGDGRGRRSPVARPGP